MPALLCSKRVCVREGEKGPLRDQSWPSGAKWKPFSPGPWPIACKVSKIGEERGRGHRSAWGARNHPIHERSLRLKKLIGVIRQLRAPTDPPINLESWKMNSCVPETILTFMIIDLMKMCVHASVCALRLVSEESLSKCGPRTRWGKPEHTIDFL